MLAYNMAGFCIRRVGVGEAMMSNGLSVLLIGSKSG